MKTNWNAGRLQDTGKTHGLHKMPCSGWKGSYPRNRALTGYHRQLDRAEMAVLVLRLQRQSSR